MPRVDDRSTIQIPAWVDAPTPSLPDIPLDDLFAAQAHAVGASRKIRGASDLIGLAAQGAALAFPGAGPAIAAASSVFSIFSGFFSSGPESLIPPSPEIAGEDANEVALAPLKTFSRAVAVGRLAGSGGGPPGLGAATAQFQAVLRALRDASFESVERALRAESKPYSVVNVALFAAACDYEFLFDRAVLGTSDNAKPLGRLLAFGGPRLRALTMISLLHYWQTRVFIEQNRGRLYDFSPAKLRDSDVASEQWLSMFVSVALPLPRQLEDGSWAYDALGGDVLRAVVNTVREHPYYDFGPAGRRRIEFPGKLGEMRVKGAGLMGSAGPWSSVTSPFSFEQALNLGFLLGQAKYPEHVENAKALLGDMRAHAARWEKIRTAVRRVGEVHRARVAAGVSLAALAAGKRARKRAARVARKSSTGLIITGGVAAAAAAALLLR